MATFNPHAGDIGTILRMKLMELPENVTDPNLAQPIDLTNAADMTFTFVNSKKRRFVVPATLTTDGTDGRLEYSTQAGDLDISGRWKMQAKFRIGAGIWNSEVVIFQVDANI
jgi:hypothetical protein